MVEAIENALGRGLHIAHLNCQSICNKFDLLKAHQGIDGFDILTLSETWLNENHPSGLYAIPGYSMIRQDRTSNMEGVIKKRGGGVAIYHSQKLTVNSNILEKHNRCTPDMEIIWVMVENLKHRDVVVASTYRPPMGNAKIFCKELAGMIREIKGDMNRDIFILGDCNIDCLQNSVNRQTLYDTVRIAGMRQIVASPTRITGVRKSVLDLIITNSEAVKSTGVRHWGVSDHEVVYLTRKKLRTPGPKLKIKVQGRSYINFDSNKFQEDLRNSDWSDVNRTQSVDEKWDAIEGIITGILDRSCPVKTMTIPVSRDPWITRDLLRLLSEKNKMGQIAKDSGLTSDHLEYVAARRESVKTVRRARADYIKRAEASYRAIPKKFWEIVRSVFPTDGDGDMIRIVDGDHILEGELAAVALNNHFTEVGRKLAEKFDETPQIAQHGLEAEVQIATCVVQTGDIIRMANEIEVNKAATVPNMSSKIIKLTFLAVPGVICGLMNASLQAKTFPNKWKKATVVPIHKDGNKTLTNNYRPISLLPLPGKILEKLMHAHLLTHLNGLGLLHENQGGFRKGKSTTQTITTLTNEVLRAANDKQTTAAAFIDFKKAFDTVDHDKLLRKLERYGITGSTQSWIRDYLAGRTQRTRIGNFYSGYTDITHGVPQGSVLGPLLFIIYINDLVDNIMHGKIMMYADDTVIYAADQNPGRAIESLDLALEELNVWSKDNKITINQAKSKVILFGVKSGTTDGMNKPKIGRVHLEYVESYKYLGLRLDARLTYRECTADILNKTAHKIWLLAKLKKYISDRMAVLIYKTMVLPYFDYADVVYHAAPKPMLQKLQRMQNKGLKICGGVDKRYSTREIHTRFQLPRLEDRRVFHLKLLAYQQAKAGTNLDRRPGPSTRLGDGPLLKTVKVVRASYERSVDHMTAKLWNALSSDQRSTPAETDFRRVCERDMMDTVDDPPNPAMG